MPPLPVTAAQALLTSIGNQAKALYSIDNNPVLDPSGFIASNDPAPIFQRPAKQLARAVCRTWARQPGPSTNPAADRLYAAACGEYLDSIGEGVDPGTIGPPFLGGQCPEKYIVTLSSPDGSGGFNQFTALTLGPIRGLAFEPGPSGSERWFLLSGGTVVFGGQCFNISSPVANNSTFLGSYTPIAGEKGRIDSISPCGADNCGDPPPEYERPRPPITLPPITPIFIDLPDIGEINVNVTVDTEGLITIESPTLDVEVNIGGPSDGPPGGVDPADIAPGGGTPGSPADTGNGGTASGCAPAGLELVGVRVEVLESPIGANTYDRVSVTVFRGIGYVRMGYPNRLALDMGGAAVISPQFFLAPVRGLTCWEVRANTGFIIRATPYYRELPE